MDAYIFHVAPIEKKDESKISSHSKHPFSTLMILFSILILSRILINEIVFFTFLNFFKSLSQRFFIYSTDFPSSIASPIHYR